MNSICNKRPMGLDALLAKHLFAHLDHKIPSLSSVKIKVKVVAQEQNIGSHRLDLWP